MDSILIFAENALVNEFKEVIMTVLQVEIIKMDVTHDLVAWKRSFPWCFLFNNRKYWLEKFWMFSKVFDFQWWGQVNYKLKNWEWRSLINGQTGKIVNLDVPNNSVNKTS